MVPTGSTLALSSSKSIAGNHGIPATFTRQTAPHPVLVGMNHNRVVVVDEERPQWRVDIILGERTADFASNWPKYGGMLKQAAGTIEGKISGLEGHVAEILSFQDTDVALVDEQDVILGLQCLPVDRPEAPAYVVIGERSTIVEVVNVMVVHW